MSASAAQLAAIATPLVAAQARTAVLIAANDALIDPTAFTSPTSDLDGVLAALDQAVSLYGLRSTLQRMATNVIDASTAGSVVTQAGGDLYRLAATALGDATAWPDIARANGLSDPVLDGLNTLTVPPRSSGSDGVLQP